MKDKLKNSMWTIAEKLIAVFGLIFVTSYVAKYVGPTTFGIISIAMLVFQFIQTIALMGSDVILLKRIAQNHHSGLRLMMATFLLVLYCVLSIVGMAIMEEEWSADALVFICAAAIACLFSSIDLINIYNEAMLNARLNVIANVIGLAISLTVRFLISYYQLEPAYLAIPIVLATFIPFTIKLTLFLLYERRAPLPALRHVNKVFALHAGVRHVAHLLSDCRCASYPRQPNQRLLFSRRERGGHFFRGADAVDRLGIFIQCATGVVLSGVFCRA
ncbi:hypothetical protein E05_42240 [Plautia stali symbiont]|nr:hypothetical protein E05_42240 [Plautia stali symbiont]